MGEILRFADFELDRGAYELRRNGRGVALERRPLDLLFLLIERPGRLVTREEIIERVWGKGVFVDAKSAINTAIRKLRRALNGDHQMPCFVATIPTKGYRFVGVVARAHYEGKVPARTVIFVGQHAEGLDDVRGQPDQLIETLETDDDSENARSPYDGQPFHAATAVAPSANIPPATNRNELEAPEIAARRKAPLDLIPPPIRKGKKE